MTNQKKGVQSDETTQPFISEVVDLIVITFQEMARDEEGTVVPSKSDLGFLREKLTAVYERGRADGRKEAVNYIKDNMMFSRDMSMNIVLDPNEFTDLLVAALTTEGKV